MKSGSISRIKRKRDTYQLLMLRVFAPDAKVRSTSFVLEWIARYRRKGKVDALEVLLGSVELGFVKVVDQSIYLADEKGNFTLLTETTDATP